MAINNTSGYHEEIMRENILKLREIQADLPSFCKQYFRGIEEYTSSRTRLSYAYDIRLFFEFLKENNPSLKDKEIKDFPLEVLDMVKREDVEEYLEYLSLYEKNDKEITNDERGKARKLSSLRSMYKYFYTSELISTNAPSLVATPKIHQKEIVRLEPDEVATLLDMVEDGEKLTKSQLKYHGKTKIRDVALLTLLLGTGIRVSECVGLDIKNVDFKTGGLLIKRKGGKETTVYFGDEVRDALLDYMEVRSHIIPESGSEDALFLSLQNKRLCVRSVENLVKKYASNVTSLKKITPHKLRSTYGTSLYRETGDIYLVADVLGHKDVNTTRKHYAAIEDARKRSAANVVKLRDNGESHGESEEGDNTPAGK